MLFGKDRFGSLGDHLTMQAGGRFTLNSRFQRAIAIARAQQAKSFELRAALSLARLWRDRCKRTEARNLLV
jgi:hypothetical protein